MTADKSTKTSIGSPDYKYGGYSMEEYERIFSYKRDGTVPTFEELEESRRKGKQSTFKHKSADFYISPDGTSLMYCKMNKTKSKRTANGEVEQLEEKKMRRVIQKGEVERIIRSVHEGIGHLMINNTMTCALLLVLASNVKRTDRSKISPLFCTLSHPPNNALSQWGMDLVTLPETDEGYHYLIVAIDHLTKWPEAQPIKRKTAANVLTFFEGLCMRFGYPNVLITDQGREFCNKDMDKFCTDNCIDHRVTAAYHLQSNGLTERMNQTIKMGLQKTLEGKKKEWPLHLNRVLFGIRLHRPRSTKESPYKLLYGFNARFPVDNKLDNLNQVSSDNIELTEQTEEDQLQAFLDGVEEHYEQLQNDRLNAHTKIKIEQSKQKTAYDTKHAPRPFKKGDKVLLQNSHQLLRMAEQFEIRFTGPYFIDRVTQANTCYLMRNDTTALKKPVNAARLKLFIEKPDAKQKTIYEGDEDGDSSDSSDSEDREPQRKNLHLSQIPKFP
uniref:Integrase catalytic domain-containing protein n=1 Tax=Plectus sambesii TaxID=2011161 RepID=A0A914VKX2_9BILA